MPANDVLKVEDANVRQKPQQIASRTRVASISTCKGAPHQMRGRWDCCAFA